MPQNLDKLSRKVALYLKNKDDYISIEALAKKMNLSPSTISSVIENNLELFDTQRDLRNPDIYNGDFYDVTTYISRVKLSSTGYAFIANDKLIKHVAFRSIFVYPIVIKIEWAIIGFLFGVITGHINFILDVFKKIFEK